MNLLVAMMVNHMSTSRADSVLNAHRVEEISSKVEVIDVLIRKFCPCCRGYITTFEKSTSLDFLENGQPTIHPKVHMSLLLKNPNLILSALDGSWKGKK